MDGLINIAISEPVAQRSISITENELTVTYIQHGTSVEFLNKVLTQPKAEVVSFEKQNIKIQLKFEAPLLVSAGTKLDMILIKIKKDYFLFAVN